MEKLHCNFFIVLDERRLVENLIDCVQQNYLGLGNVMRSQNTERFPSSLVIVASIKSLFSMIFA